MRGADFVIEEFRTGDCHPKLCLYLEKALSDFLQCRLGESEVDWRNLIHSTLDQEMNVRFDDSLQPELTRREQKGQEMSIVAEIDAPHDDVDSRVEAWEARTGKSRRTYFRQLMESASIAANSASGPSAFRKRNHSAQLHPFPGDRREAMQCRMLR